jgi:transposase
MSKALSLDLRVRVLAAVTAGASHREAGERFGVSAASVSRWRTRERQQGDARPKALGGDRRSGRIEAHTESPSGEGRLAGLKGVVCNSAYGQP